MAQQLHQSRQADTGAEHACGECMAHLVGHDMSGNFGLGSGGGESRAQLLAEHLRALGTRQEKLWGSSRRERAQETEPRNEGTNLLIDGRPAFVVRSEEHTSELQSLRHLVCR